MAQNIKIMDNETQAIHTRNLIIETLHQWEPISKTQLIECARCSNCNMLRYRVAFGYMHYHPHLGNIPKDSNPQCIRLNQSNKKQSKKVKS